MRVLVACEFSGIVRDAFSARGHDAWSCDLLPTEMPGNHIQGDVLKILDDGWDLMIAHPPCTYLTVTANKWFKKEYDLLGIRKQKRRKAITFFLEFAMSNIPKIATENPVGVMSTYFRKPNQIISPHQFGYPVQKRTCLWLKELPSLNQTKIVDIEFDYFKSGRRQSKWHTETGKIRNMNERRKARSRTFPDIAKAMAEQWG